MSQYYKYRCVKCGCDWRLNLPIDPSRDEPTWSLFNALQKPCAICDNSTKFLCNLEPVLLDPPHGFVAPSTPPALPDEAGEKIWWLRKLRREFTGVLPAEVANALTDAASLIERLAPRWISVEERLPKDDTRVLLKRGEESLFNPWTGQPPTEPVGGTHDVRDHTEALGRASYKLEHLAEALGKAERDRDAALKVASDDRDTAEQAQREVAGLRADAERYRWLRSEAACTEPRHYEFWNRFQAKLVREESMDALIDSALKEPKND